jgi:hypothetical protein
LGIFALLFLAAIAFVHPWMAFTQAIDQRASSDERLLRKHGIAPSAAGIGSYLKQLTPSVEQQIEIRNLIAELASSNFRVRENATLRLTRLGFAAQSRLENAAKAGDLEVRRRAKEILAKGDVLQQRLMEAVLRATAKNQLKELAAPLLASTSICSQRGLRSELWAAIQATATAADVAVLREKLAGQDVQQRAAALIGLEAAQGKQALAELVQHLANPAELVRLAAAQGLARHDPRRALATLVELLSAEDLDVRRQAAQLLRELTRQRFGYASYAEPAARRAAEARWSEWLAKEGAAGKLYPLGERAEALGRLVFAVLSPNVALEWDAEQKESFRNGEVKQPTGCQGLANGNRLFAAWGSREIVEFDTQGKEVWRKPVPGTPCPVQRLANGATLVGLFSDRKLIELNADGEIVWQVDVAGQPTDARRLPNGNTLASLFGVDQVVELDRQGAVVWKAENIGTPESARMLPNGNILVASSRSGRAIQINDAGQTVWSTENLPGAYDALELPNGNILVAYSRGIREVDRQGKTVRENAVGNVRRISYY